MSRLKPRPTKIRDPQRFEVHRGWSSKKSIVEVASLVCHAAAQRVMYSTQAFWLRMSTEPGGLCSELSKTVFDAQGNEWPPVHNRLGVAKN